MTGTFSRQGGAARAQGGPSLSSPKCFQAPRGPSPAVLGSVLTAGPLTSLISKRPVVIHDFFFNLNPQLLLSS